ncbi:MAG: 4'-phosphopantetheinyl transferase superfamily protein [Rhodobacteraceae bacterium]|nr:4'-phosphopantetheinyl transferase superfamily protein [Paracoccaceae bacterium]
MPEHPLLAALRGLAPAGAGIGWADPRVDHALMPGESLAGPVPARRREFSAGRVAARMAMAAIGLPAQALPMGGDRAPIWPAGVTGSITHSPTACLAVVLPAGSWRGIGIDLEPDTPLTPDLWGTILRPEELAVLHQAPEAQRARRAKLVFSAKEAAYKAQYPVSRTLFGFEAMAVTLGPDGFSATFCTDIAPFIRGDRINGRIATVADHILTLAFL